MNERTQHTEETNISAEYAVFCLERIIKRQWIMCILLIVLLVGSNVAWLYYESQFETVETWEITQENADGYNNYIGNDGDIINGETNNPQNENANP